MSSYDKLRRQQIEIGTIVEWHFTKILCAIKLKLKTKQTFREPFKFKFTEPIPLCVFRHVYNASKSYKGETTPPAIIFHTIHDKPGRKATKTLSYNLKFFNFYSILHVFTHILNGKCVLYMLKKTIKKNNICVIATAQKPFVFHYNCKREMLVVSGCFEVVNEYGVICSI